MHRAHDYSLLCLGPLLCALALLPTGCADDAVDTETATFRAESLNPAEAAALEEAVCKPTLMVGKRPDAPGCPSLGPWVGQRLFEGDEVPASLARYCRYRWTGEDTPGDDAVDALAHSGLFAEGDIAPDCQAVLPQGDPIVEVAGPQLESLFHWRAGRVDGASLAAAYPGSTPASITTAVVDTYPRTAPDRPNSDHGPIVASIVEAFACPSTACTVEVRPTLGLPRTHDGLDTALGGYVGMQSDLARGVFRALQEYRSAPSEHLIINLSVGWEAALFGGDGITQAPPAVEAVYDALRVARCEGALIVAAAGNSSGLRCQENALAPGRWEEQPAPSLGECIGLGVISPEVDPASYAPLVHSVGGLDGLNRPMPGTRREGMPRLFATATHGVATPIAGLDARAVRTGTSIASAVAAGAASLLWAHHPGLSPSQVMGALYATGHDTGAETATFGATGPGTPVHRIDVCGALDAVCARAGSRCGTVDVALDCSPDKPTSLAAIGEAIAELSPPGSEAPLDSEAIECPQACGGPSRFVFGPPGQTPDCEQSLRDPTLRLTHPQPNKPGCQDCSLKVSTQGDADAELTFSDAYADEDLITADIEIVDANTGETFVYPITDFVDGDYFVSRMSSKSVASYSIPISLHGVEPLEAKVVLQFGSLRQPTEDVMVLSYEEL